MDTPFRFTGLVLTEPEPIAQGHRATLAVSLLLHGVLIAAVTLIPILIDESLPSAGEGVRALFAAPAGRRARRARRRPGGAPPRRAAEVRRTDRGPGGRRPEGRAGPGSRGRH